MSGYILSHYGLLLSIDGRAAEGQERHREALEIAHTQGDENLRAEAHYDLAIDALLQGHPTEARSHLAAAVTAYEGISHVDGLVRCVFALGALALDSGDGRLAARLVGAAGAARATIGLATWPSASELEHRTTQQVSALLPADEFAALVESGRGMSVDRALAAGSHLLTPA